MESVYTQKISEAAFKKNLSESRKEDYVRKVKEKAEIKNATNQNLKDFSNRLKESKLTTKIDPEKKQQLLEETNALADSMGIIKEGIGGNKFKAVFNSVKLAFEMRKRAEQDAKAPWIIAISAAIVRDISHLFPLIGKVFGIPAFVYLLIFLWGKGRWKVKLFRFALLLIDFIPFIDILPWTSFSVVYAYYQTRKKLEETKKLEESYAKALEMEVSEIEEELKKYS